MSLAKERLLRVTLKKIRDYRIVEARLRGESWIVISAREGLSASQCRRAWVKMMGHT